MKYTEEEKAHMLEYANKWYHKGKEFYSTWRQSKSTVHYISWNPAAINEGIAIWGGNAGWIYSEGNWAKLVNDPQPPPYIPLGKTINYEIY